MKCLSSALAFASTTVVTAIFLGFLFSGLNPSAAWSAIACGTLAAVAAWRTTNPSKRARLGFWDWLVLTVFALSSLRAFLWVIYSRGDEICVLSPNNLGDLSLHLNLIRYLANGVAFWPESSILSNAPLSYPLGADLLNSLLEICGVDTMRGLVWAGLAGAALTGYALWSWGGAFGVAAFLFNGGLAGFAVLRTLQIDDFQRELVWKNLFLSMFVTQRGLLFALPAGLLLLHAWRERYFRGANRVIPFWLQLLLYASMPLFNLHAFLFLSLVLLAIFIASFFGTRAPEKKRFPSAGERRERRSAGAISRFFSGWSQPGPRSAHFRRFGCSSRHCRHPSCHGIFLGFFWHSVVSRLDHGRDGMEPVDVDLEFWPCVAFVHDARDRAFLRQRHRGALLRMGSKRHFLRLLRHCVCALGMGQHEADTLELACGRTVSLEKNSRAIEVSGARRRLRCAVLFRRSIVDRRAGRTPWICNRAKIRTSRLATRHRRHPARRPLRVRFGLQSPADPARTQGGMRI